jgi:integrase
MMLFPARLGGGRGKTSPKGVTVRAFGAFMKKAYDKAGLEGVTNHGLRYNAACDIHDLGLSWEFVGSIVGHETRKMAEKYSLQRERARTVISLKDAKESGL